MQLIYIYIYIFLVDANVEEDAKGLTMKAQDKNTKHLALEGKTKCNTNCMLLGNVA